MRVPALAGLYRFPCFPGTLYCVEPANEVSAPEILAAVLLDKIGVAADPFQLLGRGNRAGEVYFAVNEPHVFEVFGRAPAPVREPYRAIKIAASGAQGQVP